MLAEETGAGYQKCLTTVTAVAEAGDLPAQLDKDTVRAAVRLVSPLLTERPVTVDGKGAGTTDSVAVDSLLTGPLLFKQDGLSRVLVAGPSKSKKTSFAHAAIKEFLEVHPDGRVLVFTWVDAAYDGRFAAEVNTGQVKVVEVPVFAGKDLTAAQVNESELGELAGFSAGQPAHKVLVVFDESLPRQWDSPAITEWFDREVVKPEFNTVVLWHGHEYIFGDHEGTTPWTARVLTRPDESPQSAFQDVVHCPVGVTFDGMGGAVVGVDINFTELTYQSVAVFGARSAFENLDAWKTAVAEMIADAPWTDVERREVLVGLRRFAAILAFDGGVVVGHRAISALVSDCETLRAKEFFKRLETTGLSEVVSEESGLFGSWAAFMLHNYIGDTDKVIVRLVETVENEIAGEVAQAAGRADLRALRSGQRSGQRHLR